MKYNTRDLAMTQDYNEETQQWEPGDLMLSLPSIDHNGLPREGTVDLYTRSGYDNVRQMLGRRFGLFSKIPLRDAHIAQTLRVHPVLNPKNTI